MTKKQALLNQVDEIMDSFDFRKVASVMKHLNWTWIENDGPPDEYDIRKNARMLMNEAIAKNEGISTGGWLIIINSEEEYGKKWARIDLAFCVDQTFHDGVEYDQEC